MAVRKLSVPFTIETGADMITSSSNGQVKQVILLNKKAKERRQKQVFVAEGPKMFREAPKEWIEKVYLAGSFAARLETREMLEEKGFAPEQDMRVELVDDRVFAQMSDTLTPQGILCIVRQPQYQLEELLQTKRPLLVVLEDLQDPGNVGTILRTGEGAGITGVILSKNTADIFNPKTIRSTMGSIYRVPFVIAENLEQVMARLKEEKILTYAAHLDGKNYHTGEDYRGGSAFLIGNEGNGLSSRLTGLADIKIRIPMEGQLESLNAAIAASLLMYEANRQRKELSIS